MDELEVYDSVGIVAEHHIVATLQPLAASPTKLLSTLVLVGRS